MIILGFTHQACCLQAPTQQAGQICPAVHCPQMCRVPVCSVGCVLLMFCSISGAQSARLGRPPSSSTCTARMGDSRNLRGRIPQRDSSSGRGSSLSQADESPQGGDPD
eukprot:1787697-Rhodomonas_salina.2